VLTVASTSAALAIGAGWTELLVVAVAGAVVLVVGLVVVLLPNPADAHIAVQPDRVTVGDTVAVVVGLVPRFLPVLFPVLEVRLGDERRTVRLPLLLPHGARGTRVVESASGRIDLPTPQRGVHAIGPVTRLRTDPCGCFRRRRVWPVVAELYVRPRIALLDQQETGRISDLEGVVSDRPAPSDLAFHTLREYERGDDLRHVHWRSSAKAGQLLVRQFVETRRSEAVVIIDAEAVAYPDDEDFELAVSIGASMAVRAALDRCEVTLASGGSRVRSDTVDVLLDESCRLATGAHELVDVVAGAIVDSGRANLAVVVTGPGRADEELLLTASQLPAQALRILVRVDRTGPTFVRDTHGVRLASVARLSDLPGIVSGAAR
jgi:uncharacterized protein (DUF58 family)